MSKILAEQLDLFYRKGVNYNNFKSDVDKIKENHSLDEILNHENITYYPI